MHEVAQALEDISVDALGVADLEEAIALRAAGIKSRVMCWILSAEDDFEMAAELRERIAQVNGMSHEELRKAYVETLCQGELCLRGGAGLGLISMAKKAEGTLNYQFDEQGNKLFLFTLGVLVKN
jgi:hypothetical protein